LLCAAKVGEMVRGKLFFARERIRLTVLAKKYLQGLLANIFLPTTFSKKIFAR
jgi:hypothetical protein